MLSASSGILWATWHQVGSLKDSLDGSIYTTEIENCYKTGFSVPQVPVVKYQNTTGSYWILFPKWPWCGSTSTSIAGLYKEFL